MGALQQAKPDAVIYLAKPALANTAEAPFAIRSAVDALRRFSAECAELGVGRLVFASSAAVYGTREKSARRESDAVHAHSPYAELKLRSEEVLGEISGSLGLSVLAFRIFNVYGPGFPNSLVNRLAMGDGRPPLVRNTENFVRDYIHAADVALAFRAAMEAPSLDSPILNVGTGIGTSNRSLLALCANATYRDDPAPAASTFSIADITRIKALWGFEPRISLEAALKNPDQFLH